METKLKRQLKKLRDEHQESESAKSELDEEHSALKEQMTKQNEVLNTLQSEFSDLNETMNSVKEALSVEDDIDATTKSFEYLLLKQKESADREQQRIHNLTAECNELKE